MSALNPPRRSVRLKLEIEADSPDEMVRALENFAIQIDRGEVSRGVYGGSSSGAIYEYSHDPSITHDSYFKELREHLNRMSAEPPK